MKEVKLWALEKSLQNNVNQTNIKGNECYIVEPEEIQMYVNYSFPMFKLMEGDLETVDEWVEKLNNLLGKDKLNDGDELQDWLDKNNISFTAIYIDGYELSRPVLVYDSFNNNFDNLDYLPYLLGFERVDGDIEFLRFDEFETEIVFDETLKTELPNGHVYYPVAKVQGANTPDMFLLVFGDSGVILLNGELKEHLIDCGFESRVDELDDQECELNGNELPTASSEAKCVNLLLNDDEKAAVYQLLRNMRTVGK